MIQKQSYFSVICGYNEKKNQQFVAQKIFELIISFFLSAFLVRLHLD